MPRPLVFSNGSFFVGLDPTYTIRDLFFPQVGRFNHLSGHPIRMGVWVSGSFAWIGEEGWQLESSYRTGSLVGETRIWHEGLQVEISSTETVSHRESWFVRRMTVKNLSEEEHEIRIFFSHDLRIMESDIGDTSLYHPGMDGVVHYKDACYFLFGGSGDGGVYQYACGIKGFAGLEGTWRDAEDGELSMNPIAQGSVDSTVSFRHAIGAGDTRDFFYWILASDSLEKLAATKKKFSKISPDDLLKETEMHWREWSGVLNEKVQGLGPKLQGLCCQSLLLMRSHIDNGGAIIAATDSDIMETNRANYCYMWPRDGALISSVLDQVGQHHLPRAFFEFCNHILPKNPPMLKQKYTADGRLGATWHPFVLDGQPHEPFQEDETALMMLGMWEHHAAHPDLPALRHHFDKFIEPAADYLCRFRDPSTGLTLPSYDLWEERLGVHTFTVCTVIAGLRAAAQAAKALGSDKESHYAKTADGIRSAMMEHMVDPHSGIFWRRVTLRGSEVEPDRVIDSSLLHLALLGVLDPLDARMAATAKAVEERLWINGLGGLARYEGDYYFRRHEHLPGNPWVICTLWLAQYKIVIGDKAEARRLLQWCADQATSTGVLPEQVDAVSGEHLSVSPLTWSHAEFVKTCLALAG